MRLRTTLIAIMLMLGVTFSLSQQAFAATKLYANVTVEKMYFNTDGRFIALLTEVNDVFQNKWFEASAENAKAILAVFLTAESLNKPIRVGFYDGDPSATIFNAGFDNSSE